LCTHIAIWHDEILVLQTIDEELIGSHQMKLLNNPASGLETLLQRYVACDGADSTGNLLELMYMLTTLVLLCQI